MKDNYPGYLPSRWDQRYWNKVYKNIRSLDSRLEILSQKLNLTQMPFLKNRTQKEFYLLDLEDLYWEREIKQMNP